MKSFAALSLIAVCGLFTNTSVAAFARQDSLDRLQNSANVLQEVMAAPDKGSDRGLQHLLSSKFELSGEGSAAAGPVGRHASAGTDWKLNTEVLTYSRSRGAFAGITLEGAVVEQDDDSTMAIYGRKVSFRSALTGRVHAPASTGHFMAAVNAASGKASVHEAKEPASPTATFPCCSHKMRARRTLRMRRTRKRQKAPQLAPEREQCWAGVWVGL